MEISDELMARMAEAVSQQNAIDYAEAGPKAPYAQAMHLGVILSSRYDVLHEYETMRCAVSALSEILARRIQSVFCDSKACAAYSVTIRPGAMTPILVNAIFEAFASQGGFNVLDIEYDGQSIFLETGYWPGEDCF